MSPARINFVARKANAARTVLGVLLCAGCLFGMLGLVLAAPLVSAAVRIAKELDQPLDSLAAPEPAPPPTEGDTLIRTG